jgi:hypothetical protein
MNRDMMRKMEFMAKDMKKGSFLFMYPASSIV